MTMKEAHEASRWVASIPKDLEVFLSLLERKELPVEIKRQAAGAINYLFKSVDLIPDGLDDLGYIDDAFTLRLSAARMDAGEIRKADDALAGAVERLALETAGIRALLGDDLFGRFSRYVAKLADGCARGRSAAEIVASDVKLSSVFIEVKDFVKEFNPPPVTLDERLVTKLRSFLDTRLPR